MHSSLRFVKLGMGSLLMLLICSVLVFAGCRGSRSDGVCSVSGNVTLKGQPVGGVNVILVSPISGKSGGSKTESDGSFRLKQKLDEGEYVVTILPDPVEENPGSGTSAISKIAPAVPQKYHSETTSELRVNLKRGENHFDWKLER